MIAYIKPTKIQRENKKRGDYMTLDELSMRVVEVAQCAKSNTRRIDQLEEATEALNSLTTSVHVMVSEQKNISKKVDAIDTKVSALEQKPARQWEGMVDKVTNIIIGAVITYLISRLDFI